MFLQGYQTTKDTQKFREIRELLGNENKSLIDIIKVFYIDHDVGNTNRLV